MTVKIQKGFSYWWLGTGLPFLGLAGWMIRKRKKGEVASAGSDQREIWSVMFRKAQKHKLEGKVKEYCLDLFFLCQKVQDTHPGIDNHRHYKELLDKIEHWEEEVRYGGKLPQESEINALEKLIEWSLNKESWEEVST